MKKRERLAKKYAPRQRDPYSRAPAMQQVRSGSVGTAHRGISYAGNTERNVSPSRAH